MGAKTTLRGKNTLEVIWKYCCSLTGGIMTSDNYLMWFFVHPKKATRYLQWCTCFCCPLTLKLYQYHIIKLKYSALHGTGSPLLWCHWPHSLLPKKAALKKVKLWGFQQHQNIECACHPALFKKRCPDAELPIWMFPKIVGYPPKSWILIGFSIINHPFWGTLIFANTHIEKDDDQERKIDSESLSLWCFSIWSDMSDFVVILPPWCFNESSFTIYENKTTGWWFQPIWKICSSNWSMNPQVGVKIKKHLKPPVLSLGTVYSAVTHRPFETTTQTNTPVRSAVKV